MYLPAAPGFKLQGEANGLYTLHSTSLAQATTTFLFQFKLQNTTKIQKHEIKYENTKTNLSRATCAHLIVSIASTCT